MAAAPNYLYQKHTARLQSHIRQQMQIACDVQAGNWNLN